MAVPVQYLRRISKNYLKKERVAVGLLRFFVGGVLAAGCAELVELKTVLEDFFVLVRAVIKLFASRALEFDEVILRHNLGKSCWKVSEPGRFCQ